MSTTGGAPRRPRTAFGRCCPPPRPSPTRARWYLQTATTPTATAACSCGYNTTALGATDAVELVTAYTDQSSSCS